MFILFHVNLFWETAWVGLLPIKGKSGGPPLLFDCRHSRVTAGGIELKRRDGDGWPERETGRNWIGDWRWEFLFLLPLKFYPFPFVSTRGCGVRPLMNCYIKSLLLYIFIYLWQLLQSQLCSLLSIFCKFAHVLSLLPYYIISVDFNLINHVTCDLLRNDHSSAPLTKAMYQI